MKDAFAPGTKHKTTMYVLKSNYSDQPHVFAFNISKSDTDYVLISTFEVEYEIPADFNAVAAEVSMLEKQLDKLSEDHMQKVRQIKGRINDLLAIGYEPKTEVIDGHEIQLSDQ
jgi:hypothetical protein